MIKFAVKYSKNSLGSQIKGIARSYIYIHHIYIYIIYRYMCLNLFGTNLIFRTKDE